MYCSPCSLLPRIGFILVAITTLVHVSEMRAPAVLDYQAGKLLGSNERGTPLPKVRKKNFGLGVNRYVTYLFVCPSYRCVPPSNNRTINWMTALRCWLPITRDTPHAGRLGSDINETFLAINK